jgi:hypothetical protein
MEKKTLFWKKFEELKTDENNHDGWQNPEMRDELEDILTDCGEEENQAYFSYIG